VLEIGGAATAPHRPHAVPQASAAQAVGRQRELQQPKHSQTDGKKVLKAHQVLMVTTVINAEPVTFGKTAAAKDRPSRQGQQPKTTAAATWPTTSAARPL